MPVQTEMIIIEIFSCQMAESYFTKFLLTAIIINYHSNKNKNLEINIFNCRLVHKYYLMFTVESLGLDAGGGGGGGDSLIRRESEGCCS